MKKQDGRRKLSPALTFILLFGTVSLFSDMTHEGASSIRGVYFSLLGASAATIGFVSGLGELVGYGLRYAFGRLADRTKQYWPLVILGYFLDILAVPALAFVGEHGWIWACGLLIVQRMGKAIKKPAKNTLMSFAASREGAGRSFALQELMDQIGAFLGPVLLYLVLLRRGEGGTVASYARAFLWTAVPGAVTLFFLFLTKRKFPEPENFEPEPKEYLPFRLSGRFVLYLIGLSLFSFGYIDYSLVIMHVGRNFTELAGGLGETATLLDTGSLPLLYAGAMLVDALAALCFGFWFDKRGVRVLCFSTALSAPFALLVFGTKDPRLLLLGIALWGIGMGAQESILKAAVVGMVPKNARASGYGIFELACGVFWFLGSWLLGLLYERSIPWMIALSSGAQLLAILFFFLSGSRNRAAETT